MDEENDISLFIRVIRDIRGSPLIASITLRPLRLRVFALNGVDAAPRDSVSPSRNEPPHGRMCRWMS